MKLEGVRILIIKLEVHNPRPQQKLLIQDPNYL